MSAIKTCGVFIAAFLLMASCNQFQNSHGKNLKSKDPDMPVLENPAGALRGVYVGTIGMRMDESRPLKEYPGTFTVASVEGSDGVMLSTSIKPGAMPLFINYTLQKASPLRYSQTGYIISGSFKVDVTLGNGSKKDMPDFYFTLNDRSRITRDSNGYYWLDLYYPDQKMANGKILPGGCFFRGKKEK